MRGKSRFQISAAASVSIALCAALAAPALAARAHRHPARGAATAEAPPAAALAQIHVLGERPAPFLLDAKSAYLVDAETGAALYAFNEHQRMQPASLAKIMTFYLTLDALKAGKISLDTQCPVSEAAWRLSVDQTVSHMFLEIGQKVAVKDLLYGLMVSSGNDAALVLAEYLAGSAEGFAQMMNDKGKELGLVETKFTNPDGLPTEGEYTTAADMVKLGRSLLQKHPEAITYTSAKGFTFHNIYQRNFDTLLFYDSRVNGIKTGHVAEAGFHLVASATSGGMSLISAVMGTPNMEQRRLETKKLLDWAFRTFVTYKPDLKKSLPAVIDVRDGVAQTVAIAPAGAAAFTLGRGEESKVAVGFTPAAKFVEAPVAKGQQVGELAVTLDGKPQATIPIVTQRAVARAGLIERLRQRIRRAI